MRFVAAINTRIYGRSYAQGAEIDTTGWTRKQMLQFLNLGLMQAGEITAGMIADAITFTGAGVTITTDAEGRLVVNIEEVEHELDWLLDVDTAGKTDGQLLSWNEAEALWKPITVTTSGPVDPEDPDPPPPIELVLADLLDVAESVPSDGEALCFSAGLGLWVPAAVPRTLEDLDNVHTADRVDGSSLIWDQSGNYWRAGIPSATSGPPGLSAEDVRDIVGQLLAAGSGVTITVDDAGNTVTISTVATLGQVLMADGGGSPTPLLNEAGDDWLYQG
ncbi:MAG TPA: hypothetical protein VFU85_01945 [Nocardioides sp.]|nr:hypothetical protein [Nocardioides sp.]